MRHDSPRGDSIDDAFALCLADLGTLHWGENENLMLMAGRSAGLIMRRIRPGCMAEARALLMEQTLAAMAALSLHALPGPQPEQPLEMPRSESGSPAQCIPAVRQPQPPYVPHPLYERLKCIFAFCLTGRTDERHTPLNRTSANQSLERQCWQVLNRCVWQVCFLSYLCCASLPQGHHGPTLSHVQVEKRINAEERSKQRAALLPAKRPLLRQPAGAVPKKRPLARVLKSQTPQLLALAKRLLGGSTEAASSIGHAAPGHGGQPAACALGAAPQQMLLQLVDALRPAACPAGAPTGAGSAASHGGSSGVGRHPGLAQLVAKMYTAAEADDAVGRLPLRLRAPGPKSTTPFTSARDPFATPAEAAAAAAGPRPTKPAGHMRLGAAPSMVCSTCERGIAAGGEAGAWACSGDCRRAFHGVCMAAAASRPAPLCGECSGNR